MRSMIIGTGMTPPAKSGLTASKLVQLALEKALAKAGVRLRQLEGIVAVPSLSEPRFMEAHYLATRMGLLPSKGVVARTIDTGGAGPISGLLEADYMIRSQGLDLVAVVAGDAVSSLPTEEFLKRADAGCFDPDNSLPSPVIPHGYDRIAQWAIDAKSVTREQLAMTAVLMSQQAIKHPLALTKKPHSLQDVLNSKPIGKATNLLECARRADGGAAILVASSSFVKQYGLKNGPMIIGGGEASGPLYPPKIIDEEMFSCEIAMQRAYEMAHLSAQDIHFFGLYDCFPICFIRALEAVQLVEKGQGGHYIEKMYQLSQQPGNNNSLDPNIFPINTHGGLLSFGAPWETPAMYNIIEAVSQCNQEADGRQVTHCQRALVYGNGGIFSASAVAILEKS
jgi:acetyl-CoA acetyltransferase